MACDIGRWAFREKWITTLAVVCSTLLARAGDATFATGITEPFLHVALSASVPGIITAKNFKEGDSVKQGDTILELDKTLEELEKNRRTFVADDKKKDYESTAIVFEKTKSVSKDDLLKKEVESKVAAAERDIAAEQLKRRFIAAPFTGQITEITVEVGEACQPYQPIVKVVDVSRCYFVANIEAKLAARLKLDQSVKLEVESGTSVVPIAAKIIFISPVVDPASGLVKVRAVYENADGKTRPGLAAKLIFE